MPNLYAIRPLFDISANGRLLFQGIPVEIEAFLRAYDQQQLVESVERFLEQNPQVEPLAAYATLALAGHYSAYALEPFLTYASEGLSDQAWGDHVSNDLETFKVDWENLVTACRPVEPEEFAYLAEIHRCRNREQILFGRVFDFRPDPEFESLLDQALEYRVLNPFIAALFCKTVIAPALTQFASTPEVLHQNLLTAQFRRVSPFYLEAVLAEYLYHTGIYTRFFQGHSPGDAQNISRDFIARTCGSLPEEQLCLTSRYAWGDWFDAHSCCDLSILAVQRRERKIWLFTVSDSD